MHIRTDMPTNAGVCRVPMPTFAVYICPDVCCIQICLRMPDVCCAGERIGKCCFPLAIPLRMLPSLYLCFTYSLLRMPDVCCEGEQIGKCCFPLAIALRMLPSLYLHFTYSLLQASTGRSSGSASSASPLLINTTSRTT
jgi:hypothetical protein